MLQEGLELMGIGMGVVFAFLVLLVICLEISTKFFEKFGHLFPDPPQDNAPMPARTGGPAPDLAVAVAAAARRRARALKKAGSGS